MEVNKKYNFKPVIKWSGSKRSQGREIISHFPSEIDTYYEPFCGGGSVFRTLMDSSVHKVGRYVISDYNNDLIELWKMIKEDSTVLGMEYEVLWNAMKGIEDIGGKSKFFNSIRDSFNVHHNPIHFFFLLRTCFNGMPRYNNNGEFNTSYHINRDGINPKEMKKILSEWSGLLNSRDVEFECCDYRDIVPSSPNDFVYLDPPYANTKGMYSGGLDNSKLFEYLRSLPCPWAMSYDGKSGNEDNTFAVPVDLYDEHVYLKSGNSSFKRTVGIDRDAMVYESLYINLLNNTVG